jgi:hypothetical protein
MITKSLTPSQREKARKVFRYGSGPQFIGIGRSGHVYWWETAKRPLTPKWDTGSGYASHDEESALAEEFWPLATRPAQPAEA